MTRDGRGRADASAGGLPGGRGDPQAGRAGYRGQFAGMFMCEFVATYGQDDRDYSLEALADLTRHSAPSSPCGIS